MKVSALIDFVRGQLNDRVQPYLWSDADLLVFADEAVKEAGRNPLCRVPAIVSIVVNANQVLTPLPERTACILKAMRAGTELVPQSTQVLMAAQLDNHGKAGTPTAWSATPSIFMLDMAPVANLTIDLSVQQFYPALTALDQDIAVPDAMQNGLAYWVMYRALSIPDSDTGDDGKAAMHLAQFEAVFGRPQSFHQMATRMVKRGRTVRSNW
jgi:hypothetical protein